MQREVIPVGWTTPLDYQLEKNGASFNASGMTVAFVLRDRLGTQVGGGTTSWLSEALSQARYAPASTDYTVERSPLTGRFEVTDGSGKKAYFPKNHPIVYVVENP